MPFALCILRRFTLVALTVLPASTLTAEEPPMVRLTFQEETPAGQLGDIRTAEGKIAVDVGDGGLLFLDRTGRLWPITPDRLKSREETGKPFSPFSQEEMAAAMRQELGEGFEIVTTRHYVLCTEASREYARWAGMLFERLMGAFMTNWGRGRLDVEEPEFPLCAIILADESRYQEFARADAGPDALEALGYYSTLTNRMVMYDLTEGLSGSRPRNILELNARLAGQIANVSTIVHEATHQIAFNSGLHTRLADNPFWLVEGMAMYFETPDLRNAAGWRTVGRVNTMRLQSYKEYVKLRRPPGSLKAMLTADEKFHTANTALDAYAEAWALSYFLIKTRREDYMQYLKTIAAKEPLEKNDPDERLAEFEAAFGEIEEVERALNRYILRAR